ncbi:Crp/Fnr family transcriptional regulator [Novosphingobium pokkalii]|nr:Crp/Fnr family transcriptional regulator [Novosphingobium pokkalii]
MPCNALGRRLARYAPLDETDLRAIERLCAVPRHRVPPRREFLREGDRPGAVQVLLEGWAQRLVLLPDGRRQITGFALPGDVLWRPSGAMRLDFSVIALTPAMIVPINAGAWDQIASESSGMALALARQERVAEAIERRWLVNLGQRTAFERLGHLFCELCHRLDTIGMVTRSDQSQSFAFPVTQVELAEATGLSPVHVNRVLREMRSEGLIRLEQRTLHLLKRQALAQRTLFDPAYLEP